MIKSLAGFMTAAEMKAHVTELTGYEHGGFDLFADALGRLDPASGARTNDRPTLITVLILRKLAGEVAAAVVERETFLDDGERIVFGGIDLAGTLDDGAVDALSMRLYQNWVGIQAQASELAVLRAAFGAGGHAGLLGLMLQNAALYYF